MKTNWITAELISKNWDLVYGQCELGCSGNQSPHDDHEWEECFAEIDGVTYSVPVYTDEDGDVKSPGAEGKEYLK